ncbi:hypothetical protein [Acidisphaera sp. L21]|uniref:hypothetical protein n=1 Tax=Acidisphaera sp. L21 TaxID=1641851 RepID=UPI00131AA991|nr:hypothetical protein [Acidisphaera sp. L21]
MTFRFQGLVPAFALLVVGAAAHAQSTGGGGQMAYPDSLPSGQVRVPAPTARDTGNMAYPASPGGVTTAAPTGRDTGNMAYPTGGAATVTTHPTPARGRARPGMSGATPAAAAPAPTASGMAAAQSLNSAPGSAPVPYTDFATPGKPMMGRHGAMHAKPMHHVAAKKKAAAAPAAAAPAAPAPAAPAK